MHINIHATIDVLRPGISWWQGPDILLSAGCAAKLYDFQLAPATSFA